MKYSKVIIMAAALALFSFEGRAASVTKYASCYVACSTTSLFAPGCSNQDTMNDCIAECPFQSMINCIAYNIPKAQKACKDSSLKNYPQWQKNCNIIKNGGRGS